MTAPSRSGSDLACTVLAAAAGLGIGWLDLHATEVVVTIVPLLAAGLLLGLLGPKAAWRWAALIAVGLPVMAVGARLSGIRTAEPVALDPRTTLVALAFALGGTYAGVLVRHVASALVGDAAPRQ